MSFLMFFLSPVGRYVGMALAALALVGGIYLKGHWDGKAAYRAKLAREISAAIEKGDRAREEALKKFDANKDFSDGFERD